MQSNLKLFWNQIRMLKIKLETILERKKTVF